MCIFSFLSLHIQSLLFHPPPSSYFFLRYWIKCSLQSQYDQHCCVLTVTHCYFIPFFVSSTAHHSSNENAHKDRLCGCCPRAIRYRCCTDTNNCTASLCLFSSPHLLPSLPVLPHPPERGMSEMTWIQTLIGPPQSVLAQFCHLCQFFSSFKTNHTHTKKLETHVRVFTALSSWFMVSVNWRLHAVDLLAAFLLPSSALINVQSAGMAPGASIIFADVLLLFWAVLAAEPTAARWLTLHDQRSLFFLSLCVFVCVCLSMLLQTWDHGSLSLACFACSFLLLAWPTECSTVLVCGHGSFRCRTLPVIALPPR